MKKTDLKVIEGGLLKPIDPQNIQFQTAYVTDTRLMGVLVVYCRWLTGDGVPVHQFFYIDCEEAGLETYYEGRGEFNRELELKEHSLIGGLGCNKVTLKENDVLWLLSHWRDFNISRDLPLPKGKEKYDFIFDREVNITDRRRNEILSSICDPITIDYQVVNYFLMRCFGRDYEGAVILTDMAKGEFPLDLYDCYEKTTFCRNVIDILCHYGDGSVSYLCESLVEMNGIHEIVVSKVVVKDLKVVGFEHCSGFPISSKEAALMLRKPEFVTVYEVLVDDDVLEDNLGEFTLGLNTLMSEHNNGRLFMAYKKTNDHVKESTFMLSNDVKGVFFLTDFGQLIVMANSIVDIHNLQLRLSHSPLFPYLAMTAKYEFLNPVLFQFINSDFEDFEDFLSSLQ